ncbi:serine/threonine protein kinase [Kineococcus rubinsiae]|uniref:serine/threonine protein kinase n=1 Tax=Kineococcus rubinsiae TaxID=2609562 RepID=UPI0014314B0D|nr:serine/threonine-protein kinase [Kineococcus rubinsiae]NIZ89563.1 protein kinase [Kineococcus rubinsiae]
MVTPFPRSPGDALPRPAGSGGGPDATPSLGFAPGQHAPAPGSRLGRYRLDRVVGEGGMGVVYLALDPDQRAVALKVLKPHIAADPHARQRLVREVATLERVRSPRVAEVLEADVEGPWPHLVTRYVPGMPLDAVVESRGPLTGTALRDLGHGLAEALHAIHAAGVVHRDLKPGNVLLLDGMPVVIDFGIAHVADDVRLTSTGLVMGTPGYLSPEVVLGGHVSPATDWWGWAATVAYAASGRAPFGKGPMEVVLDRVRRADVDLSGVPGELRAPLLAALAVDPADRPDPAVLLSALDGATTGALPQSPPASRFSALMAPETAAVPVVRPGSSASAPADGTQVFEPQRRPAAESPAESTTVLPPVAAPTAQVPQAPARATVAQQAPPGWIPGVPGPGAGQPPQGPAGRYGPPPQPGAQQFRPTQQPGPSPQSGRTQQFAPGPQAFGAPSGSRPAGQDRPRLGTNGEPARPQRSWTLLAGLLALLGVVVVAPTAGVILAFALGVLARTVDRAAAGLFRRRWEAGPRSSDALAVGFATPWHVVRAVLSTLVASIIPVLVGVSVVFIGATLASGELADRPDSPVLLGLGGLAGLLVAWFGPGSRSLQRGGRTVVRTLLRGERETGIVIGVLLLVAVAALLTSLGAQGPDWSPLAQSPLQLF